MLIFNFLLIIVINIFNDQIFRVLVIVEYITSIKTLELYALVDRGLMVPEMPQTLQGEMDTQRNFHSFSLDASCSLCCFCPFFIASQAPKYSV